MSACLPPRTAEHTFPLPISAEQAKAAIGRPLETLPSARRCDLGGLILETRAHACPGSRFLLAGQPEWSYPIGLTRLLERLAANASSPAVGAALAESPSELESWSRRGVVPRLGSPAGARGNGLVGRSDAPRRDQVLHEIQFVGAAPPLPGRPVAGKRPPARATSGRVRPLFMDARRRFAAPTIHLHQRVTRSGMVASRCTRPRSQRRGA